MCLLASAAAAQATESQPGWTPPATGEWDWLHLSSKEWLKGELKSLRDRKLKFDSDEFDDVEVDLEDVQALYLYRLGFIRTDSGETAQGTGVLRGDVLTFETVDGRTLEIERQDIVSIVPGGETELDYWSGEVGASYAMREGNTDEVDLSGLVRADRETATTRFRNEYRGVYASQNGQKNTNNHRATSKFDVFLTSRFYLTVPEVEYYKDEFKNLKHRVSPGGGVGYEFLRNQFAELDVGVGSVYQYTEFENGDQRSDFAGTASVELDFDLPGGSELDNSYSLQYVVTDPGATSQHFESILSVDIWGPLDLDVTFMVDRIEKPEKDGGDRPKSNDFTILAGISLDF